MDKAQIALVQKTFAEVAPQAEQAAAMFYERLFEIAPGVKPLFKGDMRDQGRKLMGMIGTVVKGLDDLASILPAASALAKNHVGYGVKAGDYASVGAALLWTLQQGLGEKWTPEVEQAWKVAYTTLSDYMISEAYGEVQPAK